MGGLWARLKSSIINWLFGPSGIVDAEIQAKDVTIEGKVVGNISAVGIVTIQSHRLPW